MTFDLTKFLKPFMIIKFIIIGLCVGSIYGKLQLGDRAILAENSAINSKSVNSDVADESAVKTKESILDKLFNLPEINTNELKKDEIGKYLRIIENKKREVEERLSHLQSKEATLIDLGNSIDKKLVQLDNERRFFIESVQKEKKQGEERVNQLVDFYKKMPPKKAAPVFEKLDKDLVVQLFNRMPQKQITSILASLNPEKSVELTEYFGRVRSGNEYEILKEMNLAMREEFKKCQ